MSEAMPEPVAPAAPVAEPAAAPQNNEADLPPWAREAITKANREAASYRTQVAELKPQADQFKALEEASKSEAQRLAETVATAQRDAETARADAIRYKVAATHGIKAEDFDLLGSGTEEEITARAVRISSLLAAQVAPAIPAPGTRPVAQLTPGATPAGTQSEDDVLYAQLYPAK